MPGGVSYRIHRARGKRHNSIDNMVESGCFQCDTACGCTEIFVFPAIRANHNTKGGVGTSCVIAKPQVRLYGTDKATKTSTNKISKKWEGMNSHTQTPGDREMEKTENKLSAAQSLVKGEETQERNNINLSTGSKTLQNQEEVHEKKTWQDLKSEIKC